MDAKKFLEADYLDIVFENRNKAYGSYELRKNYARRVKKAGLFALLGVVSLVSFSFITSRHKESTLPDIIYKDVKLTEVNTPKKNEPKLPQPATPPPPPPSQPTRILTPPIITDEEIIEKPMTEVKDLANAMPGISTNPGDSLALGSAPVSGNGPERPAIVTPKISEPVTFVDQMPQFPGDLGKYLADNIAYPENARAAGIQGRVVVKFIVNEDGTVTDLQIIKSVGSGCDQEALRVLKMMPKWKPGKNNGVAVRTYYNQPIVFKLD